MPRKKSLLLAGGYFPKDLWSDASLAAGEFIVQEQLKGRPLRTDLSIYELPIPPWDDGIELIPRDFWSSFSSDSDYYESLVDHSLRVHMVAYARAPDHRDRINLVSSLCSLCTKPFSVHLF